MIRSIETRMTSSGIEPVTFLQGTLFFSLYTIELKYSHYNQEVLLMFVSPSLKMCLNTEGEIMYL
jgi:hypothetical protein